MPLKEQLSWCFPCNNGSMSSFVGVVYKTQRQISEDSNVMKNWWWLWSCFCGMFDLWKASSLISSGEMSKILTSTNLQHAASRIRTCTESDFRLCWMKLYSSDSHCIMAPLVLLKGHMEYRWYRWCLILGALYPHLNLPSKSVHLN